MPKILLIDDDDAFRGMLRKALEQAGYVVDDARDGREGLRRYRVAPAELVITDLLMPEQNGLATIQALRQEDPTVKIIAISGGGRTGTMDFLPLARSFGALRTLWKPFPLAELLEAMREVLQSQAP
jgi:DNA-binding response OmpR family regulator